MLKINGKVVKDVVYNGKRIERIMVGSKKYYDMYDGRISGYANKAESLSLAGKTYSYNAGYFDIYIGEVRNYSLDKLFANKEIGTLTHIGLDTSHVTSMNNTFQNCGWLTTLDLSGLDTSHVTSMDAMFYNCESLTTLDLSGFDTSHVTNMDMMLYGDKNLKSINIGNMDLSCLSKNMIRTFNQCSSLTTITGSFVGLKLSVNFSHCPLDHDSAMMVINSAEKVTTAQTIAFSAYTKALLSDEEKAVATNKGWTIA